MRAPSHAPAVRYPYGRSRVVGGFLGFVALAGLAGTVAWLAWGAGNTDKAVKAAVGMGLWAVCAAAAWNFWRRIPAGRLAWDGGQWVLECGASGRHRPLRCGPQVHLDVQAAMLLSVRPWQGRQAWLWLERRADAPQWDALRRAVYSRARAEASGLAEAETTDGMPSRRDGGAHTKT